MELNWWFHAGSTYSSGTLATTWASTTPANRAAGIDSIFDSTSRTFFITGVQLEVGDTATPFEVRSFGDELLSCQRYYAEGGLVLTNDNTDRYYNKIHLPVNMRAKPTITVGAYDTGTSGAMTSAFDNSGGLNSKRVFYQGTAHSTIASAWFAFDAEL